MIEQRDVARGVTGADHHLELGSTGLQHLAVVNGYHHLCRRRLHEPRLNVAVQAGQRGDKAGRNAQVG